MGKIVTYVQAGGFGTRLCPLLHQPGLRSVKVLSPSGRNLLSFNHNSYYAVAKPVLPYFGVALSEPLVRRAISAGARDIRFTLHNMPETVVAYYQGRPLGDNVKVRFLYEHIPLDTSGGIVRDVVAGILDGSIKKEDTILILGGDIRTSLDIADFLGEHERSHADITILLAEVPRKEMYRFGAAVRDRDDTKEVGTIQMSLANGGVGSFTVYGELKLNEDKMARITHFFEKRPALDPRRVINPGGLNIDAILQAHGVGALAPTNLQNGSVYAFRAELIYHLAPLVFNLSPNASPSEWREAEDINIKGASKFSDFGGDWFMVLTGSKPLPEVSPSSPIRELQQQILEGLQKGLPEVFGYRLYGRWSDDGTLPAVLEGHFELLDELVDQGTNSSWPINWAEVRNGYPPGVITMSTFDQKDVTIHPPVFIGRDVTFDAGAKIGPYAVINDGWRVAGKVINSVLFPKKRVDWELEESRGWQRFVVPASRTIFRSLIGSGFEPIALDPSGNVINDLSHIANSVVVSNGSENVISPIDI